MDRRTAIRARVGVLAMVAAAAIPTLHAFGVGWVASTAVTAVAMAIGLAVGLILLARARRFGTTSLPAAHIARLMSRKGMLAPGEQIVYGAQVDVLDVTIGGAPARAEFLPPIERGLGARLNAVNIVWLCVTDRQLIIWGLSRQYVFELGRLGKVVLRDDGVILLSLSTPHSMKLSVKPIYADAAAAAAALDHAMHERWYVLGIEQLEALWGIGGSTDAGVNES